MPGQPAGPTTPKKQGTPKARQGTITLGVDGSAWTYWWEYNKSAFLLPRLLEVEGDNAALSGDDLLGRGARREKRSTKKPGPADAQRIAKALRERLQDRTSDQHMVSSCLLSLAKTGHASLPDIAGHLKDPIPVIRESAILALGISGIGEGELRALLDAGKEGTRLRGGQRPNYRDRSFAAYALGISSSRSGDLGLKRRTLDTMIQYATDQRERVDVRVAALHALRILDLPAAARSERKRQLETLQCLALDPRDSRYNVIQVQALTALRGPLSQQGLARERMERRMAALLAAAKQTATLRQATAQTLGFLSEPDDEDVLKALMHTVLRDKDELTRRFAIMAMGRIGGEQARSFLLAGIQARRPRKSEYPWLALALALSCQKEQANGTLVLEDPQDAIGQALLERFQGLNTRMPAAGVAIALGLLRYDAATKAIRDRLARWHKSDEPASYLALALGLMGNSDSRDEISSLMLHARHREIVVVQSALALPLLGDKSTESHLQEMLAQPQSTPVLSALAMAIGRLGSRSSVDTLITRLDKHEGSTRARAFVAVALGELLIQDRLRWNAPLSWGIHYRYSPATLTGNSGVVDQL